MKAKLKNNSFEYLLWKDNLREMKRFCGESCTITYESCHLDDYFSLRVDDALKDMTVTVALNDAVVKLGEDLFTVIKGDVFNKFFENEEE